jgi:hypothetical protein
MSDSERTVLSEEVAMLPGPDRIIACPLCGGLARHETLLSGNNIGERIWTDGKRRAPMLPTLPQVVKCRHCKGFYWRAEAEIVGSFEPWDEVAAAANPGWSEARDIVEPTEKQYYQILKRGFAADAEEEVVLRSLAMQRRNDAFRNLSRSEPGNVAPVEGTARENLEAFAALLVDADDDTVIMKAEVLRELGEFWSARSLLDGIVADEYSWVVQQLLALCDKRDPVVRELQFEEEY